MGSDFSFVCPYLLLSFNGCFFAAALAFAFIVALAITVTIAVAIAIIFIIAIAAVTAVAVIVKLINIVELDSNLKILFEYAFENNLKSYESSDNGSDYNKRAQ